MPTELPDGTLVPQHQNCAVPELLLKEIWEWRQTWIFSVDCDCGPSHRAIRFIHGFYGQHRIYPCTNLYHTQATQKVKQT
jgi:hypothetical protein